MTTRKSFQCGLVPVIRLSDLLAPNPTFVYALECRQSGNAFVKLNTCSEPEAVLGHFDLAVGIRRVAVIEFSEEPAS
jgi:hypothetical protein